MRTLVPLLLTTAVLPGQVVPVTVHGSVMVATVQLNGQGSFRMIVDTGASSCSIAPAIADRLQLRPEYRMLEITSVGRHVVPASRSVDVGLGAQTAKNVEFLWQESSKLKAAGLEVDGVLGQSLLSRYDYLLDYKSSRLVLDLPEQPLAAARGRRIDFARIDGRILLPAMNPDDGTLHLVLDSGASNLVLWRTSDRRAENHLPVSLIAMDGRRAVSLFHMPLLVVGDQVLLRLETVVSPSPDEAPREDGLLPAGLFQSIYVSNSGSYVKLRR